MSSTVPQYLLLSETQNFTGDSSTEGRWRFVLQQIDGSDQLDVSEREPELRGERLQLLTVIRGLEALDQPSRVTIVTSSHYVSRGIRRDLAHWREDDWHWERFGQRRLIKNHDLWQRLDRALGYHQVQCRAWRFDSRWTAERPDRRDKTSALSSNSKHRRRHLFSSCLQVARRFKKRMTVDQVAEVSCA